MFQKACHEPYPVLFLQPYPCLFLPHFFIACILPILFFLPSYPLHSYCFVRSQFKCIFFRPTFFFIFIFCLFRATPMAYAGTQARGSIEAVATGLHHSLVMPDPSHIGNLRHSSWQLGILNPLSKARDRTCILMDTSQIPLLWPHRKLSRPTFLISRD